MESKSNPWKALLTSKAFYAALVALVVILVQAYVPSFKLDGEKLTGFMVVIGSYILGVAVDPGPAGWRGVLKSRKFWAAVVGVLLTILPACGVKMPAIPDDAYVEIAALLGALIAGFGLEANFPAYKFR